MAEYTKSITDPILRVGEPVLENNSITGYQYVVVEPTNANNLATSSGGQIRFVINQTDRMLHPHNAYVQMQGQYVKVAADGTTSAITDTDELAANDTTGERASPAPINNAWASHFSDVRYDLGGTTAEHQIELPTANLMYRLLTSSGDKGDYGLDSSFSPDTSYRVSGPSGTDHGPEYTVDGDFDPKTEPLPVAQNEGWFKRRSIFTRYGTASSARGTFNYFIPLKDIFGFCHDYKQVISGSSHTIVFTRKDADAVGRDALQWTADPQASATAGNRITPRAIIKKMTLHMPYVDAGIEVESKFNQMISNRDSYPIAYRQLLTARYAVPESTQFSWNLTSLNAGAETPMWGILSFQRDSRRTSYVDTSSMFEALDVKNVSFFVENQRLPVETRHYDTSTTDYLQAYSEAQLFKHHYDGIDMSACSPFSIWDFKKFAMIHVVDLNNIPANRRSGTLNIRVEASFGASVPAGYSAYATLVSKKILHAQATGERFSIVQK